MKNWIETLKIIGTKVTAISFIVLILIGNVWLIKRFTGESFPQWSQDVFALGLVMAAVGFLLLVPGWLKPRESLEQNDINSESDKSKDS